MKFTSWPKAVLILEGLFKPPLATKTIGSHSLSPIQEFGYDYTTKLIQLAVERGLLDTGCTKKVCDFGAGTGGPTLALRDFFSLTDLQLTLLEENQPQTLTLKQLFPGSYLIQDKGLKWLASNKQKQDLITAFMLGPDYEGDGLAFNFIHNALACLAPTGKLLIASDTATMHTVTQVLKHIPGIVCHWLFDLENIPVTAIVSKSASPLPHAQGESLALPTPIRKKIYIPETDGLWVTEEYCLSTTFEKAYLQASIKTFEYLTPSHPAIPYLNDFLLENTD